MRLVEHVGVTAHHSVTSPRATVQNVRRNHREKRGFDDIGYHYIIREGEDGWCWEHGRDESLEGAHCKEHNNTIGVCVFGDYEENELPAAAQRLLVWVLADVCIRHGFDPRVHVEPHCHRADTLCPGVFLLARWEEIIDEVEERMEEDAGSIGED